jgi:hypothetical protein
MKGMPSRADMDDDQRRHVKKEGKKLNDSLLVGTGMEQVDFDENMVI